MDKPTADDFKVIAAGQVRHHSKLPCIECVIRNELASRASMPPVDNPVEEYVKTRNKENREHRRSNYSTKYGRAKSLSAGVAGCAIPGPRKLPGNGIEPQSQAITVKLGNQETIWDVKLRTSWRGYLLEVLGSTRGFCSRSIEPATTSVFGVNSCGLSA